MAPYFFVTSDKEVGKKTPPRFASSSSAFVIPDIFGCCGTPRYKSQLVRHPRRKPPQISLIPQLAQGGDVKQSTTLSVIARQSCFWFLLPHAVYRVLKLHPGKSAMDGRFSRDEPGWRMEAAVKVKMKMRGKPQAKLPGVYFFGYFLCTSKESYSPLRAKA